jgi:hypothetical protein
LSLRPTLQIYFYYMRFDRFTSPAKNVAEVCCWSSQSVILVGDPSGQIGKFSNIVNSFFLSAESFEVIWDLFEIRFDNCGSFLFQLIEYNIMIFIFLYCFSTGTIWETLRCCKGKTLYSRRILADTANSGWNNELNSTWFLNCSFYSPFWPVTFKFCLQVYIPYRLKFSEDFVCN